MSAKTQPKSNFVSYLGWILFILTLPALAFAWKDHTKAQGIIQRDACIANLKQIDDAKEQWALENKKRVGEVPEGGDLKTFLKKSFEDLKCRAGGRYTISAIGTSPQCSITGHKLP